MTLHCKHNIPETLRGSGPCVIKAEVKLRNGRPNWWCHTHGLAAGAPDGLAAERCPGAWLEPVPEELKLDLDASTGEIALWGVVGPALSLGDVPSEDGKVHVHRRRTAGASKDIDKSFDIVTVHRGGQSITVEGMAAVAYSLSELSGRPVTCLTCPHCGGKHIDEKMFATRPHRKHLCNSCGRNFGDSTGPSISNPLAQTSQALGLATPSAAQRPNRPLDIVTSDYTALALWPSNRAIISTMSRAEEEGIHVHGWQAETMVLDETYSQVTLDGERIDEDALRALAVQRALSDGQPILARGCSGCGSNFISPHEGWVQASTTHTCPSCGQVNKTRRKSFLNPLGDKG